MELQVLLGVKTFGAPLTAEDRVWLLGVAAHVALEEHLPAEEESNRQSVLYKGKEGSNLKVPKGEVA